MKSRMNKSLIGVLVGSLVAAATWPVGAQTSNTLVYDVTGLIDTSDFLIIHGDTLQWHHTGSGAAVGRHSGPNHWEVWLRDPDGYTVVLVSPDGSADGNWRP